MAMNRIQFQPGMSLPEFNRSFGSEAQCEQALMAARWPNGWRCPRCAPWRALQAGAPVSHGLFQCQACQHQTSLTAGTLLSPTASTGASICAP